MRDLDLVSSVGFPSLMRGMKSGSGTMLVQDVCNNRPETELESGFRQRTKNWSMMRESQCLDTDLNRMSDLARSRIRISVKRSLLAATLSADEVYSGIEEATETFNIMLAPNASILYQAKLHNERYI